MPHDQYIDAVWSAVEFVAVVVMLEIARICSFRARRGDGVGPMKSLLAPLEVYSAVAYPDAHCTVRPFIALMECNRRRLKAAVFWGGWRVRKRFR